jgi:hypothetical protein
MSNTFQLTNNMRKLITKILCVLVATSLAMTSCKGPEGDIGPDGAQGGKGDKGDQGPNGNNGADGEDANQVVLTNHSTTSTFLKKLPGFESVEDFSLIGSADYLPESPSYVFGGAADGAGLLKTADGFVMMVNNEDNIAVSRLTFDKTFRPVKGEYYLNSNGGDYRLCSATLATPEEHGFGPLFLTCSENALSWVHGLDPFATVDAASKSQNYFLKGLGHWAAENAVPLPKTAYTGKTVILIGDDDNATYGGQLAMYVSTTGELENGSVYVLRTLDKNPRETDLVENTPVDVEFVKLEDHKTLTGAQTNAAGADMGVLAFGRVEDIDYRKDGVGREIYFNVTGQPEYPSDRTMYGRTYKLALNETDPTKGKLTMVLNGDDRKGKAGTFEDPDNILVTKNYAYISEDPNLNPGINHDAYLYQYNLNTGALKKVFELNHFRGNSAAEAIYGVSTFGQWEYGAMLDVSDILGIPNTFTLNIQAHTWKSAAFNNPDGGTNDRAKTFNEGSQIVVLRGLPR